MSDKEKNKELQDQLDMVRLQFSTEHGKDFISYILDLCGIYDHIPSEGAERQLGKRDVGLELVDLVMQVDPELYPRLLIRAAKIKELRETNG